jgi:hypothetical protein
MDVLDDGNPQLHGRRDETYREGWRTSIIGLSYGS